MNIRMNYFSTYESELCYTAVDFSNPDDLPIDLIEELIHQHLIQKRYFIPADWNLPHPYVSDNFADDPICEFHSLEVTGSTNVLGSINHFLEQLSTERRRYKVLQGC